MKLLTRLKCWLGWHEKNIQFSDHSLDAMAYALMGGMNRFEKARTIKRLYDSMERDVTKLSCTCRHCGRWL